MCLVLIFGLILLAAIGVISWMVFIHVFVPLFVASFVILLLLNLAGIKIEPRS